MRGMPLFQYGKSQPCDTTLLEQGEVFSRCGGVRKVQWSTLNGKKEDRLLTKGKKKGGPQKKAKRSEFMDSQKRLRPGPEPLWGGGRRDLCQGWWAKSP